MQPADTVLNARWIVPVEPAGIVLDDHALVIAKGRILEILPQADASERYQADTIVDLGAHALIPGLVNAHTHAAMSLFRGLADDMPLMQWLSDHIWPAEQKWVNEEFLNDGTTLACAEMLRGGVTCFNDMYFYPEVAAKAAAGVGMRALVGLIVLDFPTLYADDASHYISKGLEVHDVCKPEALISTAFAPHAPFTVSDEPLRRVRTFADELDIPIHMHIHETADEVEQSVKQSGMRPLARLERLGLLSPSLLAVHMTQLTDQEIEDLATNGVHVIHCPESNLKLASGLCPVAKLLAGGVNVALGTEGAASNNDLDLFSEMRTAALLAKAVANDASALPAAGALRMATLNGARALGLGDETGSLEPGKSADIAAVRLDDIETQPFYDLTSQLVYATGRDKVSDVWIAGQQVLKDRHLVTVDEAGLKQKVAEWQARIQAQHG
ncbi:MAG: TRZ/ATZ family hydrolase [Gammaproteobacteria bacterium]